MSNACIYVAICIWCDLLFIKWSSFYDVLICRPFRDIISQLVWLRSLNNTFRSVSDRTQQNLPLLSETTRIVVLSLFISPLELNYSPVCDDVSHKSFNKWEKKWAYDDSLFPSQHICTSLISVKLTRLMVICKDQWALMLEGVKERHWTFWWAAIHVRTVQIKPIWSTYDVWWPIGAFRAGVGINKVRAEGDFGSPLAALDLFCS